MFLNLRRTRFHIQFQGADTFFHLKDGALDLQQGVVDGALAVQVLVLGQAADGEFVRATHPSSQASSPMMILRRVDLPAPLIPTMAAFHGPPGGRKTCFNICFSPNDLLILLHDKIMVNSFKNDIFIS